MVKNLGLRGKLFLVASALILVVLIPGGLYLQSELRRTTGDRLEQDLERSLQAARTVFEHAPVGDIRRVDALVDRLGNALGCRVTVIAVGGRVLGDSQVPLAGIASVENHGKRPEVVAALANGPGAPASAVRRSPTLRAELLYLAAPFRGPLLSGVVRVAKPLDEIEEVLARQRWLLVIAGFISLAVGLGLSAAAAHYMSRTLRELVDSAHALAGGVPQPGPLAGSLKSLAEEIERTMAALASERARFAAVLEGMSEGVIALDGDNRVSMMNRAAHELLGSDEDAVGRVLLELVRVPALDELVRAGKPRSRQLELAATRRQVLVRLAPAAAPGGGAILVLHDVTALQRLERIRRDFVANASHELRTPTSVISANAETLRAGALADPDAAPALVDAIHRHAVRLNNLVTDLLDLSRLEAGGFHTNLEPVSLAAAAARAEEAVEGMAERHGIVISNQVAADAIGSADPGALQQVLVNLLSNAIVHTPKGTRVEIAAAPAGARVRVEVRDDGPGIPPAYRRRIFERFYRIDPGRSRDMGGTGLGLSIVKHLVENMGGSVGVEENRPRGALFWFELPATTDAPV
jgi:two-component system phosphate regulon sensor histidine kinase PhoR